MAEILVVDDSREIRQLVSFSLRAAGHSVLEAASGTDALAIIERKAPDLMILDVMMPGMTGFEVLRKLRAESPHGFPIIMVTAKTELSDKTEGFEAGANDYVTKPFSPKELTMRVSALLSAKDERDRLRNEAEGLQELSVTDELTGAYNRRHLTERLATRLSEAKRHDTSFSLLMIDIDHFKYVNDTHGHQAGDSVLQELVARIRDTVRVEDLVARYGGEEFVLILPSTEVDEAHRMAERLLTAISASPFRIEKALLPITVSIGAATYPIDEAGSGADLVAMADKRLYVAKHLGRNCVVGPGLAQQAAA